MYGEIYRMKQDKPQQKTNHYYWDMLYICVIAA